MRSRLQSPPGVKVVILNGPVPIGFFVNAGHPFASTFAFGATVNPLSMKSGISKNGALNAMCTELPSGVVTAVTLSKFVM